MAPVKRKMPFARPLMRLGAALTMERWNRSIADAEKRIHSSISRYPDFVAAQPDAPRRKDDIIRFRDMAGWGASSKELNQLTKIIPLYTDIIREYWHSRDIVTANRGQKTPAAHLPDFDPRAFEERARSLGVGLTGYLPHAGQSSRDLVFSGQGLGFGNWIVLGMEMKPGPIFRSPGFDSGLESMRVYSRLGRAANQLALHLQEQGFGAQPVHPYGGLAILPEAARRAGIGVPGFHGLLITPEYGPRQRLCLMATNAALPEPPASPRLTGVREFCKTCLQCSRACPGRAFLDPPQKHPPGNRLTHVDARKCYPYFSRFKGCSICIKVCAKKLESAGIIDKTA